MVSAMKVQWSSCVSVMVTMPRNRKMMQSLVAASVLSTSAHVKYIYFVSRYVYVILLDFINFLEVLHELETFLVAYLIVV